jgi:short-subunit dehydrogenase
MVVCAGVSAVRPLLEIAGTHEPEGPNLEGVRKAFSVASAAVEATNEQIPFMERTSPSPSILLISSLGAAIPAPTRSIYGSTKAASLALYQALAIEHPKIAFSYILPSTVEGSFRASAIDIEESTGEKENAAETAGLPRKAVAKRCIAAVDAGEKVVFFPPFYAYAQLLYWMWPSYVERRAAKRYTFTPRETAETAETATAVSYVDEGVSTEDNFSTDSPTLVPRVENRLYEVVSAETSL